MIPPKYRYTLHLLRPDDQPVGQAAAQVDFEPVIQSAWLDAVHRRALPAEEELTLARVEPVWTDPPGPGSVQCFRILLRTASGRHEVVPMETNCFDYLARAASAQFVQAGTLTPGEQFLFTVDARPVERRQGHAVVVGARRPPLPITEGRLADALVDTEFFGPADDGAPPVIMHERVLLRADERTLAAGSLEAGAFLLGYLRRDVETERLYTEVTDLLAARHTVSSLTKLVFTPESFFALHDAILLRDRGETRMGWQHNHSYLNETCKQCDRDREAGCQVDPAFFSLDDVDVHTRAFPAGWSVGLVVGHNPCAGLTHRLYGWRSGRIRKIGFHMKRNQDSPAALAEIGE